MDVIDFVFNAALWTRLCSLISWLIPNCSFCNRMLNAVCSPLTNLPSKYHKSVPLPLVNGYKFIIFSWLRHSRIHNHKSIKLKKIHLHDITFFIRNNKNLCRRLTLIPNFYNFLKEMLCYALIKILSTPTIELLALLNVSVILIEKFMTSRGLMSFGIINK